MFSFVSRERIFNSWWNTWLGSRRATPGSEITAYLAGTDLLIHKNQRRKKSNRSATTQGFNSFWLRRFFIFQFFLFVYLLFGSIIFKAFIENRRGKPMNCLRGSKSASSELSNLNTKLWRGQAKGTLQPRRRSLRTILRFSHRSCSQIPSCVYKFFTARYHGTLTQ